MTKGTIRIVGLFLIFGSTPAGAVEGQSEKGTADEGAEKKVKQASDQTAKASEGKPTRKTVEIKRQAALVSRLVLKVVSPDEAKKVIVEMAAEMGGFPVAVDDGSMVLKIPPAKLSKMVDQVAEQGLIIEKFLKREDLTQKIAELEGRLKSKQEILSRLRVFLKDSDVPATLEIEQTMTGLVREIEQVQGALRVHTDRAAWARVDISFQFRERDRLRYVSSPFEWLNSVGLDQFLREF